MEEKARKGAGPRPPADYEACPPGAAAVRLTNHARSVTSPGKPAELDNTDFGSDLFSFCVFLLEREAGAVLVSDKAEDLKVNGVRQDKGHVSPWAPRKPDPEPRAVRSLSETGPQRRGH